MAKKRSMIEIYKEQQRRKKKPMPKKPAPAKKPAPVPSPPSGVSPPSSPPARPPVPDSSGTRSIPKGESITPISEPAAKASTSRTSGNEYEAMKSYKSMFGGPVRQKKRKTKKQSHENAAKAERDYGTMMVSANAKGAKPRK